MRKTDPSIYSVVWCFVESDTAIRAFIFFSHYKHNSLRVISIPQKGAAHKEVIRMIATRRKIYTDKLLDAQKNMASAEKVDAKGLVYLSRFILRLLKQLDDEVIELCAEAEDERG